MIPRAPYLVLLTSAAIACSPSNVTAVSGADASAVDASGADASSESKVGEASPDAAIVDAGAVISDADAALSGNALWQVFYDRSFAAHVEIDSKDAALVSGTIFKDKDIRVGTTLLTSHGAADIMLSRVLPDGKVDWAKSYGGLADDYPVTFRLDQSDRIVMTGLYNGTGNIGGPDFQPFAGAAGRFDISVAGLSATGDHRWSKTINTTADSFAGGISLDGSGNAFVFGHFIGTATLGGVQHASAGSWDAFLTRLDAPMGALGPWLQLGGTDDERSGVALFTGADVIVLGSFDGTLTMPTPVPTQVVSAGARDIFVARISTDGKMTSATSFGGTGDDQIARAELDSKGNVIIAGTFGSPSLSVLGGDSLLSAGGTDIFVASLSSTLTHRWSKSFGGDADDFARDLTIGPGGFIAVGGEFRDKITFGDRTYDAAPSDAGVSEIDAFVLKLSEGGDPLWTYAAGGPAPDRTLGLASDSSGALYVAFSFQSPVDFGFGLLTPDPGQWASALVKFAP